MKTFSYCLTRNAKTALSTIILVVVSMSIYCQTCLLPVDPGPCRASFPRYYYDIDKQDCLLFTYGGCQGNANNFMTYQDCLNACQPIVPTTSEWGLIIVGLSLLTIGVVVLKSRTGAIA